VIRLLIADDHPVVREGLTRIVGTMPGLIVAGEATDGTGVIRAVQERAFDVVLMDITMPGPGFLAVLQQVKALRPRLPVLILSMHPEEQFAVRALRGGAAGYLTKHHSPDQLREAIERVVRGGKYISPSLAERLASRLGEASLANAPHEVLSDREFEVLRILGSGRTAKDAAAELGLSPKTISTYRDRIRQKLTFKSNAEIVRYAVEHGIS
jgi:two-component system, NarL family, invasion response regulator UvrY